MINSIGSASVRQFGLKRLGLVPPGHMEDIVRGAIGLATEGFFEGVSAVFQKREPKFTGE